MKNIVVKYGTFHLLDDLDNLTNTSSRAVYISQYTPLPHQSQIWQPQMPTPNNIHKHHSFKEILNQLFL